MVRAAAVLGRRVSFDLLAAVTGASESDLIARLRVAVDRGLLVESDTDQFGFHHELAREAIEAGLLGRERRRLHEAALAALRDAQSRDHVALTHHAQGAAASTTWWPRPGSAPASRWRSDRPTRRCSSRRWAWTRSPVTSTCWRWRRGLRGWRACSTTPSPTVSAG